MFVFCLLSSCGRIPLAVSQNKSGSLEIHTCILETTSGLAKAVATLATTCDSLIIEVSGTDMGIQRYSRPLALSSLISKDTISRIPSGTERFIKAYTVDRSGTVIHADSLGTRMVRIDPNTTTQLNVVLIPASGSIYLQLENIPTKVDSVFASFTAAQTWSTAARRSTKLFLSLDKIPNQTHGVLKVAAVDSAKDTLYVTTRDLTFSSVKMDNITLQFTSTPGNLTFDMSVMQPGATSATANMAAPESSAVETGELLITEIMYAVDDSEYIEVYNPGASDLSFDSLYIEIDNNTPRLFTGIAVAAHKAFVFGRRLLDWADVAPASASALDLSSTGNWITLRAKDRHIIDRVIFTGGSNTLEWPKVSGKQAIVLDTSINDAASNNFGRNWQAATMLITGTSSQYGSPKVR